MSLYKANATLGSLGVVDNGTFTTYALPLSLPTAPVPAGARAVPGPAVDLRADASDPLSVALVVRSHAVGNVATPVVEPAQLRFGRARSPGDGSRSRPERPFRLRIASRACSESRRDGPRPDRDSEKADAESVPGYIRPSMMQ